MTPYLSQVVLSVATLLR